MTSDLTALDATAQADLVRTGAVSALDLVNAAIARAEAVNPALNAIIHERFERARSEASAPGDAPFAGVPMVVKDLGCAIAGEPHHGGTRALRDAGYVAPHDSALYRRFRAAGFIAIGRTNTPEWGSTITTEPLAYGPTRNPWNTEHSTGGSSGGSAASVAAGIVPVGHANDGGGSIRIPASECGLVGLKPTRGRVSQGPDVGESWMGATIDGVVTRSVRDTAAVLDAICGYESGDPYSAPSFVRPLAHEIGADPGSLRIGVLDHPLLPGAEAHPECTEAVARTAALLESLGHRVEVGYPAAMGEADFPRQYTTIIGACTAADLDSLEAQLGRAVGDDDLEPDNLALAELGRSVTAAAYIRAVAGLHAWSRRVVEWWTGDDAFDLLLTPTLAGPPPKIGFLSGPGGGSRIRTLLQYTAQFNITGQPAVSLPLHISADGLPVGVQLVAAPYREDLLVRVSSQLETASPWPGIAPGVPGIEPG
jgi:amidase